MGYWREVRRELKFRSASAGEEATAMGGRGKGQCRMTFLASGSLSPLPSRASSGQGALSTA